MVLEVKATEDGNDNDAIDDNNGPTPISCTVREVHEGSYLIQYVIEVCLTDCPKEKASGDSEDDAEERYEGENDGPGSPKARKYLSLRYCTTTTYDGKWLANRRVTGLMIVSSRSQYDPDSLRGFIMPAVPASFRRESSSYELDETNLRVKFTLVDCELMQPVPAPAIKIRGRQVETLPMYGGVRKGEVQLRLEGPKGISPRDLMQSAIHIGLTLAKSAGVTRTDTGKLVVGGMLAKSLDDSENCVEVNLQFLMAPKKARSKGASNAATVAQAAQYAPGIGTIAGMYLAVKQLGERWANTNPAPPPVENSDGKDTSALAIGNLAWVDQPLPGSSTAVGIAPGCHGQADYVRLVATALNDPCGQSVRDLQRLPGENDSKTADKELRGGGATLPPIGGSDNPPPTIKELRATTVSYPSASGIPVEVTTGGGTLEADFSDDEDAEYVDDGGGPYESYDAVAHYSWNPGTAVCASTKKGEDARIVQLHNPRLRLVVNWTARRVGGFPVIPAYKLPDGVPGKPVARPGTVTMPHTELAADGVSPVTTQTGEYVFEFLAPGEVNTAAPIPPFVSLPDLRDTASNAAGTVSSDIIWGGMKPGGANLFVGRSGSTGNLSTGRPPVNP